MQYLQLHGHVRPIAANLVHPRLPECAIAILFVRADIRHAKRPSQPGHGLETGGANVVYAFFRARIVTQVHLRRPTGLGLRDVVGRYGRIKQGTGRIVPGGGSQLTQQAQIGVIKATVRALRRHTEPIHNFQDGPDRVGALEFNFDFEPRTFQSLQDLR